MEGVIPRSTKLVIGRRSDVRTDDDRGRSRNREGDNKKERRRSSSVSALTLDKDAFSAFIDTAIDTQLFPEGKKKGKKKKGRRNRQMRRSRSFAAFSQLQTMTTINENETSSTPPPTVKEEPVVDGSRRMRRRNSSVLVTARDGNSNQNQPLRRRRSSSLTRSIPGQTMYEPGKDSTPVLRRRRSSSSIARKVIHEEVKPAPIVRKTRPRSSSMPAINVPTTPVIITSPSPSPAKKSKRGDRSRSPSPSPRSKRKKPALVRKVSSVFTKKAAPKEEEDDGFCISAPFDVNAPTDLAPVIWIDNGSKELKKSKNWSKAIAGRKSADDGRSPRRGAEDDKTRRIVAQQNQAMKLLSPKSPQKTRPETVDEPPKKTKSTTCPAGFIPELWWRPLPPTPLTSRRRLPDLPTSASARSSNSSGGSVESDSLSAEGKAQVAATAGQTDQPYQTKEMKKEKRLTFYSMVSSLTGNKKKGGYQATIVGAKGRFNDISGRGKRIIMFEIAVFKDGEKWTVFRRYKQFKTLNSRLRSKNLIKKVSFKTEMGPKGHGQKAVEARGNRLNKFLQGCLAIPQANASQYMHTFIMPFQLGDIKAVKASKP